MCGVDKISETFQKLGTLEVQQKCLNTDTKYAQLGGKNSQKSY